MSQKHSEQYKIIGQAIKCEFPYKSRVMAT